MRRAPTILLLSTAVALAAGLGAWLTVRRGFSARDEPSGAETFLARRVRSAGIPNAAKARPNPVPFSPAVLTEARAHFADHCASCHGNDGRGMTTIGRNLYPKAPDMTLRSTQSLSDGELFWIIKNGVRLTGMPAWGADTPADDRESWTLVHFIRHLPKLSATELAEMQDLNPKSRKDLEEEAAERAFLQGDATPPASTPSHQH